MNFHNFTIKAQEAVDVYKRQCLSYLALDAGLREQENEVEVLLVHTPLHSEMQHLSISHLPETLSYPPLSPILIHNYT